MRPEVAHTNNHQNPQLRANDTCNTDQNNNSKYFRRHKVKGDGNCLFRSVSLYLYNTEEEHLKIRREAVGYVRCHWKDLEHHSVITNPELRLSAKLLLQYETG